MTDLPRSHRAPVSDSVDALVLDLLERLGPNPRPYAEVLEAWRTSCPRLPVWEDANDRGFIARHHAPPTRSPRLGLRRRGGAPAKARPTVAALTAGYR